MFSNGLIIIPKVNSNSYYFNIKKNYSGFAKGLIIIPKISNSGRILGETQWLSKFRRTSARGTCSTENGKTSSKKQPKSSCFVKYIQCPKTNTGSPMENVEESPVHGENNLAN